jgi:two-component system, chemotaxis family, chemotaxis protein CheY
MSQALNTVVIVDDMKLARLRLVKVCQTLGFKTIIEAANGREAWQTIAANNLKPNLILTDYNMPDMNGMQFLETVRANELTKTVPVMFITSESQMDLIMTAVSMGVTEFVVKPFADDVLISKIKNILARK